MAAGVGRNKTFGDINITPLTDVFLVLLVVVIIAAPALSKVHGGIITPEVNKAVTLKNTWLVADVDKDGGVFIDGAKIDMPLLREYLAGRVATLPEKNIVVRGDQSTQSGIILNVLRTAKEAGFEQGFIAGQVAKVSTKLEPQ
jgi:biopolymer transport protein ExbD